MHVDNLNAVVLRVAGRPAPQGSKTYMPNPKGGRGRYVEKSKYVDDWREAIVTAARTSRRPDQPISDVVEVVITFLIARPKSHLVIRKGEVIGIRDDAPVYVWTAPDMDKLVRATNDGLVKAGILKDDSLIAASRERKLYAGIEESPGALIEVRVIEERNAR